MEEKILYFDCFSGISGDMTIGAFIGLGVEKDYIINELKKLGIDEEYELKADNILKKGVSGTKFDVELKHHHHHHDHGHSHGHGHHHHRHLKDIEKIIDDSSLNDNVKEISKKIFMEVAKAEAKIHGKDIDKVHFHEVGATDSIVDIVGTAICIDKIGADKIYCSKIHVGTGLVKCAHGIMPVPAPATLEILNGMPVYSTGVRSELVTPTGAAILKAMTEFSEMPNMTIEKSAYGFGTKDFDELVNGLRLIIGKKN